MNISTGQGLVIAAAWGVVAAAFLGDGVSANGVWLAIILAAIMTAIVLW